MGKKSDMENYYRLITSVVGYVMVCVLMNSSLIYGLDLGKTSSLGNLLGIQEIKVSRKIELKIRESPGFLKNS